jgi:hypothetical protein
VQPRRGGLLARLHRRVVDRDIVRLAPVKRVVSVLAVVALVMLATLTLVTMLGSLIGFFDWMWLLVILGAGLGVGLGLLSDGDR